MIGPDEPRDDYPHAALTVCDAAGISWRPVDVMERTSGESRLRLGARCAAYRLFVAADGRRRVYAFRPGESHDFALSDLARQLRRATRAPRGDRRANARPSAR